MSLIRTLNPKLNVQNAPEVVFEGAKINAYVQNLPTNLSNANNVISVVVPNRNIGVGRGLLVKARFQCVISLTNTSGGAPFPDGYIAPRQAPLASVISTQTMVLNNMSIQQSVSNQIVKPVMQYLNNYNERFTSLSTYPSMSDQTQKYSDAIASNRNPLSSDLNNSYDVTRNNPAVFTMVGNTAGSTSVTVTIDSTEPLFLLSPFAAGSEGYSDSVLFHLDTMTWTCSLSNLNRVLSISEILPTGVAITGIQTDLTALSLLVNYITPQVDYQVPSMIKYPSFTPQLYTTTLPGSVAPGATITGSSLSIQLQGVPQKVFIWAGHPDSDRSSGAGAYELTDSVLGIESLNAFYNTQIFLSGATKEDLYNIAVKNGCRLNYAQWAYHMGSVLSLSFGDDIGLSMNEAPGMQGQQQIYFTGTWSNPSTGVTITNPQIYVLVIYGGSIEDYDGNFVLQQNTVTEMELHSAGLTPLSFKHQQPLIGGGFWDVIKKAASPLLDIATPIVSTLLPEAAPFIGPARKMLGVGYGGAMSGGYATGAGYKRRRIQGGKCYPSKAELMQMA